MINKLLSISTSDLLEEIERRGPTKENEYAKIKNFAKKGKLALAAQLVNDGYREGMPYITLGILNKKGDFKVFYYSSGLEYDKVQQLIPPSFAEACESTYEHHPKKKLTREKYIEEAFKILGECGYTRLEDWNET